MVNIDEIIQMDISYINMTLNHANIQLKYNQGLMIWTTFQLIFKTRVNVTCQFEFQFDSLFSQGCQMKT